jgi:alpha-glucoside transport system substrate-binding protein
MRSRTVSRVAASVFAVSLLASGCLGQGEEGGERVEIFGAFSGDEETRFNAALEEFREDSGIDVRYVASADFTTLIRSRVQGGNPPEIALFPQPGLVLDLAQGGRVVPLDDVLDLDALKETLIPGFLDATTQDGKVYGAPMRMAVKSLVWYPKPEFEEAGYQIPTTHAQLLDLTKRIAGEGKTPWCIGIQSGPDTGWPATDWIEEYVLRSAGPDVYDQWVKHEIPFDSPEIVRAGELFGELAFPRGHALGGRQGILNTPFGDSPKPMFEDPPACWLHRQGNFIAGFFPDAVQQDVGAHAGIFVLPPVEGGFDGQPILGGGDLAALFNRDNESAVEVMGFLTSDKFGGPWAEAGGWLSPHKTFDTSQYPDEITQETAKLAAEADVFRFDGSDLMPAAVGAGTFWTAMIDWTSGKKDTKAALTAVEQTWPKG